MTRRNEVMQCSTCGDTPPLSEIIRSRDALWHRPCATIHAYQASLDTKVDEYVDFPSGGRMDTMSIITETENE